VPVGRMSVVSPSRYFAAARQLGRFRSEAEIKGQGGSASFVANDPKATSHLSSRKVRHSRIILAQGDAVRIPSPVSRFVVVS